MIMYQSVNIAGYKMKLGLDEELRVRREDGSYVAGLYIPQCGVHLSERDIAETLLLKIEAN